MVDTANTIFRDFVTDGVPSSGANKPRKSKIREWGTWLEGIITAFLSNGGLIYDTKAHLDADLLHAANSMAWVLGDATVANNGIYRKLLGSGAGSWTRVADLPYSYIQAVDVGAGTANAIIATSSIPVPTADAGALIALKIFEANTGSPVTVAFNGGAALTIKTSSGNDLQAGYLTAGMVVAGYKSGSTFRLLSDPASAAIQAAAEAAAGQAAASAAAAAASAASIDLPAPVANTFLQRNVGNTAYVPLSPAQTRAALSIAGKPIVILATGQSNIANYAVLAWTPPTNLFLWNWDGNVDAPTATGTAFAAMRNDRMALAYSFATKVAQDNPSSPVYVINIGNGGQPISKWLTGAPVPDMYDCVKRNVEAALAVIGVSTVDLMLWWQGEADAVLDTVTYPANFAALQARLRAETWFPFATPVLMMSLSPYYTDSRVPRYNPMLRAVVAMEPATRIWVDTTMLPQALWDPTGGLYIHMLAAGYKTAGELAYTAFKTGSGSGDKAWNTVRTSISQNRSATTVLANDLYLRFQMRAGKTYRVRGSIIVNTANAAMGFKYGWVGPATTAVLNRLSNSMVAYTPASLLAGYQTGKTITSGAAFIATIDFDIDVIATSADGEFAFQWAQNVSDAAACGVYVGSYMDFMEI